MESRKNKDSFYFPYFSTLPSDEIIPGLCEDHELAKEELEKKMKAIRKKLENFRA